MHRVPIRVAPAATTDGSGIVHVPAYRKIRVALWKWDIGKGSDGHPFAGEKTFESKNPRVDAMRLATVYANERGCAVQIVKDYDEVKA